MMGVDTIAVRSGGATEQGRRRAHSEAARPVEAMGSPKFTLHQVWAKEGRFKPQLILQGLPKRRNSESLKKLGTRLDRMQKAGWAALAGSGSSYLTAAASGRDRPSTTTGTVQRPTILTEKSVNKKTSVRDADDIQAVMQQYANGREEEHVQRYSKGADELKGWLQSYEIEQRSFESVTLHAEIALRQLHLMGEMPNKLALCVSLDLLRRLEVSLAVWALL